MIRHDAETMTEVQKSLTFRHGEVRVDLQGRVAYTNGQLAKLGSRAFDLLEALIER
jgi:DNA-binding response OmpR family regulator